MENLLLTPFFHRRQAYVTESPKRGRLEPKEERGKTTAPLWSPAGKALEMCKKTPKREDFLTDIRTKGKGHEYEIRLFGLVTALLCPTI